MNPKCLTAFALASIPLLTCLWSGAVSAATCGDPAAPHGTVSVTDGVDVLRAAAELSSDCYTAICDVNLDGKITVIDGVRTLQRAASLGSELSCSEAEVPRQAFRFGPIVKGHSSASSAGHARLAVTTGDSCGADSCPDGGRCELHADSLGNEDGFTDFDCRGGQTVTNGFISVVSSVDRPDDTDITFDRYTVQHLDTQETVVLSDGSLIATGVPPGSTTTFSFKGSYHGSSSVLGDFIDTLDVIRSTENGISGTIHTDVDVSRRLGPYALLRILETQIFPSLLLVAHLTFDGNATTGVVIGGESRLCEPCTASTACGDGLSCRSCGSNCSGSTQRCAVGDPPATCEDGIF